MKRPVARPQPTRTHGGPGPIAVGGGGSGGTHKPVAPVTHKAKHPVRKQNRKPVPKKKTATAKTKKRQWSPDSDVAMCSARAVAQALNLAAGVRLTDDDVLAVYWATAATPDEGQSLSDALTEAHRLWRIRPHTPVLLLGVTLPQPHALCVAPDGTWWSWGEPFDPGAWPDLKIDEVAWCAG